MANKLAFANWKNCWDFRICKQGSKQNTEWRRNMIFLIESVVACAFFTLMIKIATAKRREVFTNDYPPVVTDKLPCFVLRAAFWALEKGDHVRQKAPGKLVPNMVRQFYISALIAQKASNERPIQQKRSCAQKIADWNPSRRLIHLLLCVFGGAVFQRRRVIRILP